MIVRSIHIRREGDYGQYGGPVDGSKPFRATIEVQGKTGKVELSLNPDMSAKIVAIIAEEVAAAGRATAEAMTADVFNVVALPSPKAAK